MFEFANPPYYELFAIDDLLCRTVAVAVPEAVEQGFIDLLDRVYQTGEPFYGKQMPLQLHRRASGQTETRHFDFTYQAFRENGQTVGILSIALDVTEVVQARQKLEAIVAPPAAS